MDIYTFTNDLAFNYFMSLFTNISLVLIPCFAAISLLRN